MHARRVLSSLIIAATGFAAAPVAAEPVPSIRLAESNTDESVALEIAAHTMRKPGVPTAIVLVGVAHIGSGDYYAALQRLLDRQEVVLFEGVKPGWSEEPSPDASATVRTRITEARMRHAGAIIERAKLELRRAPEDVAEAFAATGAGDPIDRAAFMDAWGNPLEYRRTEREDQRIETDLVSLGADAKPGGRDDDRDIALSDQPALTRTEIDPPTGIQGDLAAAMGLEFQLEAIDYTGEGWINSDVSAERLLLDLAGRDDEEVVIGSGVPEAPDDPLLAMLSGDSPLAKIAGGLLRFAGMTNFGRSMMKIFLIETLARADELMPVAAEQMGDSGSDFMRVILEVRNDVVLEALDEQLELRQPPGSVALFWGAAHLEGIQEALVADGWEVTDSEWFPAIELDEQTSGLSPSRIKSLRDTVSQTLDMQLRMLGG